MQFVRQLAETFTARRVVQTHQNKVRSVGIDLGEGSDNGLRILAPRLTGKCDHIRTADTQVGEPAMVSRRYRVLNTRFVGAPIDNRDLCWIEVEERNQVGLGIL